MKPTVRGTGVDPAQFFTASRLVIVAGKGGVGKTTVSATLARAAARSGLSSLIIEVEGKSGLASMYGSDTFSYDEVTLAEADAASGQAAIRARTLTPDEALVEYLEDSDMGRISKRLMTSGALDMVATAIPGIRDILVLGKVKQMERAGSGRPADPRCAGRRSRHLVPPVRERPGRRRPDRPDQRPGQGRPGTARRPRTVPGHARHAARGDPGQRAGRDRLPARGSGRHQPRPGGGQRPLPRAPRARRALPERAAKEAGASLRDGEAASLAAAASFRRERMALQEEQVVAPRRSPAVAAAVAPLPLRRRAGPHAAGPAGRRHARRASGA